MDSWGYGYDLKVTSKARPSEAPNTVHTTAQDAGLLSQNELLVCGDDLTAMDHGLAFCGRMQDTLRILGDNPSEISGRRSLKRSMFSSHVDL